MSIASTIKNLKTKEINLGIFKKKFIDYLYVYSFLVLNLFIILILLPPYSHVEYGTKIYEFYSTNMHLFDDKLFYTINFLFFPIISIFILNNKNKNTFLFLSIFSVNIFLIFLLINSLSIIFLYYINDVKFSLGSYNLFYVFLLFQIFLLFVNNDYKIKFINFYDQSKKNFLVFFLILSIIASNFYSPFNFKEIDQLQVLYDFKIFFTYKKSILIFLIYSFFILLLIKFEKKYLKNAFYINISYFALSIFLIIHIFYFDASFEMNLHHYSPIYGPALHIYNGGGVPGIDVHSQYGYIFFVILRFFFEFLPNSFGTTGLFIRIINVITLLVIVSIFFKISKNKLLSLFFASLFIAFHYKNAVVNFSSFPSLLGLRNLIPLISLYFLLHLKEQKNFNPIIIFLICLSSITSFESFMYTLVPYLSFVFLFNFSKRNFKIIIPIFFKTFLFIFIFHLLINASYFVLFNKIINYNIYFEILQSMTISTWWPVPTLNLFFVPFVYFSIYGLSLIYCYHLLINIWNDEKNEKNYLYFKNFFCITSLGILMMIYYVSRSLPSNLHVVSLPLYFLVYLSFEKFILNNDIQKKFLLIKYIAIIYLIFSFSVLTGSPVNAYKNNTFLYKKCFFNTSNCEIKNYLNLLTNMFHNYPDKTRENKIFISVNNIINKFYKKDKKILLFAYDNLSAIPEATFGKNNKWYFHPISYVYSDELSSNKKQEIFDKNIDLYEGQLISIVKSKNLQRLERELIEKIKKDWYFCLINYNDNFFEVFKLSKHEC